MHRTDFEDILINETPYYKQLDKNYREPSRFQRTIDALQSIAAGNPILEVFRQRGTRELVFLGRRIFVLQEEFVDTYFKFLSGAINIDQWESFFERYSKDLLDIYVRFFNNDGHRAVIFELVNRKLIRDLFSRGAAQQRLEDRRFFAERFGLITNQFFNYVRHCLTKTVVVPDSLFSDTYERTPLIPHSTRSEALKIMSVDLTGAGLPEPIFTAIFKNLSVTAHTRDRDQIIAAVNKRDIASRADLADALGTRCYIGDEETLQQILQQVAHRAQSALAGIAERTRFLEHRIGAMEQESVRIASSMTKELQNAAQNLSTEEAFDSIIKRLRRTLLGIGYDLKNTRKELANYRTRENEYNALLKLKPADLANYLTKNEWDPFIMLLMNRDIAVDNERMQVVMREAAADIKSDRAAANAIADVKTAGFLREKYDTAELMNRFWRTLDEVVAPHIKTLLLEDLVDYYPKLSATASPESIRYLAEETLAGRTSVVEKSVPEKTVAPTSPPLKIDRFRKLVSVLAYDVRGSTFMGTKLQDARKENEIRTLFQESMLGCIEKFGGVPIKDTGDGGIALFAANSYDIKQQTTTTCEPGICLNAVRCSIAMVQEARNFVQENIGRYQDWFRTAEERRINFEGATYATLPPSYQSIFQIGIGIASGTSPEEIYLDKNAFGDYDLTGMLVREANFYSKVRARDKSVAICDDATVYNLLLNLDKFAFLCDKGLKTEALGLDLEQGLEYWINQRVTRRGFIFDLYRIVVSNLGQETVQPGSIRILLGVDDITIDETGEMKDGKGGRGKFLFEITQEA